ncbi:hypothetical protein [Candidatus Neptunichlamydia sp. REUL1]|uniref:hypothetical protein n=1 Tax=Candidatus Neptunichlamydia sp. REUL1 TaxID=3064277 RepID=UPI00292D16E3|nr:hypothetical protein [Candidatus Neptunochlamydia sp. REUL1]
MCEIKDSSSLSYQRSEDLNNEYSKVDLVSYPSCETENSSLRANSSKGSTLSSYDSPDQKDIMQLNTESLQDRVSNWMQSITTPDRGEHLTYNYKNLNFFQRIYNVIAKLFGFELINPKKESNSPFSNAYAYGKSAFNQKRDLGEKRSVSVQKGHTEVLLDRESEMSKNAQRRGELSNKYTAHTKPRCEKISYKQRKDGTIKELYEKIRYKQRKDGTIKELAEYGHLAPWEAENDTDRARLQEERSKFLKTRKK